MNALPRGRRSGLLPALAAVALASCSSTTSAGGKPSPSATPTADRPISVSSSLDGMAVLPTRLAWVARPEVGGDMIDHVDFLLTTSLRGENFTHRMRTARRETCS